jgi:hypothetical protein
LPNPNHSGSWRRYPAALSVGGILFAICLWWLFRPERLFFNRDVDEKAPDSIAAVQPSFIGRLHSVAGVGETKGRVTLLKNGDKVRLEISSLESSTAASFIVALAGAETESQPTILGTIGVAGNQSLMIPHGLDLDHHRTVLLMDGERRVLAKAALDPF